MSGGCSCDFSTHATPDSVSDQLFISIWPLSGFSTDEVIPVWLTVELSRGAISPTDICQSRGVISGGTGGLKNQLRSSTAEPDLGEVSANEKEVFIGRSYRNSRNKLVFQANNAFLEYRIYVRSGLGLRRAKADLSAVNHRFFIGA